MVSLQKLCCFNVMNYFGFHYILHPRIQSLLQSESIRQKYLFTIEKDHLKRLRACPCPHFVKDGSMRQIDPFLKPFVINDKRAFCVKSSYLFYNALIEKNKKVFYGSHGIASQCILFSSLHFAFNRMGPIGQCKWSTKPLRF